jgi:hypothetical protein
MFHIHRFAVRVWRRAKGPEGRVAERDGGKA